MTDMPIFREPENVLAVQRDKPSISNTITVVVLLPSQLQYISVFRREKMCQELVDNLHGL